MRHRNPPFPIVPVILGAAGVAGLVWWVTRQSTIATTQAIVGGAADALVAPLSYRGDVQGRVLTPAEIAAITANPSLPLTDAERAVLLQRIDGGIPR